MNRLLDLVIAILLTVLLSPLFLIVAIFIKLSSPGPVLFKHQRIGQNLKPFVLYKFRTMDHYAKSKYPELYSYRYTKSQIRTKGIKSISNPEHDPRITRIGKILRKTSLDELPNLFNVIIGHMSMVGPRPEPLEMLQYYSKEQRQIFLVKPGLTGLAQIKGRGLLTFKQTTEYDLIYLKKKCLSYDLMILLKTIPVVLNRSGAF